MTLTEIASASNVRSDRQASPCAVGGSDTPECRLNAEAPRKPRGAFRARQAQIRSGDRELGAGRARSTKECHPEVTVNRVVYVVSPTTMSEPQIALVRVPFARVVRDRSECANRRQHQSVPGANIARRLGGHRVGDHRQQGDGEAGDFDGEAFGAQAPSGADFAGRRGHVAREPLAVFIGVCFGEVALEESQDTGETEVGALLGIARGLWIGTAGAIFCRGITVENQILRAAREILEGRG